MKDWKTGLWGTILVLLCFIMYRWLDRVDLCRMMMRRIVQFNSHLAQIIISWILGGFPLALLCYYYWSESADCYGYHNLHYLMCTWIQLFGRAIIIRRNFLPSFRCIQMRNLLEMVLSTFKKQILYTTLLNNYGFVRKHAEWIAFCTCTVVVASYSFQASSHSTHTWCSTRVPK